MASETSSLTASMTSTKHAALHPPPDRLLARLFLLPIMTFQNHWRPIFVTMASAIICARMGYAESWVIDPLVINAVFVVFGFTMGFRNVRANQRYFDALQECCALFSAFWGVYAPLPDEIRLREMKPLLHAMQCASAYIHRVGASRENSWYGILGVEPFEEDAGGDEDDEGDEEHISFQGLDARVRLVSVLANIDRDMDKSGNGPLKRSFALHQKQLLASYDKLVALALPSVTGRYKIFVDLCLYFFAISLPWCITTKEVHIEAFGHVWVVGSTLLLLVNTTVVIWVLFTLDTLLEQNEDPISGDADDVDIDRLTAALSVEVQDHERRLKEEKV